MKPTVVISSIPFKQALTSVKIKHKTADCM